MSWHHIIPFSLMRDVWNRLVEQHIATQLSEARVALPQYLLLCDRSQPNLYDLIDRMRAENTAQRRAGHNQLRQLDVLEVLQLTTAAVWPAWNSVEGPTRERRSDDPGDHYIDRFTAGLSAAEAARMREIETLFGQFQSFVNGGSLRALARILTTARGFVSCDFPIRFRPDMWVQDAVTGLWSKRRDTSVGH